jgi:polyisoprenoid-binding protein YceI
VWAETRGPYRPSVASQRNISEVKVDLVGLDPMQANTDIRLDADNTRVTFSVRWLGLLRVSGRFDAVTGSLRIPNGDIEGACVAIDVEAASVRTGIGLRDHHLSGPRFLDAVRYPTISFRSQRVSRSEGSLAVAGTLALRGRDRHVIARCPLGYAENGRESGQLVSLATELRVPRLDHHVGSVDGINRFNPLMRAIGSDVIVRVELLIPASRLLPALLPALGR